MPINPIRQNDGKREAREPTKDTARRAGSSLCIIVPGALASLLSQVGGPGWRVPRQGGVAEKRPPLRGEGYRDISPHPLYQAKQALPWRRRLRSFVGRVRVGQYADVAQGQSQRDPHARTGRQFESGHRLTQGCSQAERHRTLTPACAGPNPATSAIGGFLLPRYPFLSSLGCGVSAPLHTGKLTESAS